MENGIDNFSWKQIFNNNDGKTSASGVAGLYLIGIGGLCFIVCMIAWLCKVSDSLLIMNNVLLLIAAGSSLLGIRKIFKDKDGISVEKENEKG